MKTLTLYLATPSLTFLFTTASDNTPLFNGNGKVDREVLERKRAEIFSLPSGSRALGRSYINERDDSIPIIPRLLRKAGYLTH